MNDKEKIMELTREQILSASDEELQEWIALKVMGARAVAKDKQGLWRGLEYPTRIPIPSYSTDISAAWQVVEKMIERGFFVMVSHPDIDDDLETIDRWWCKFYPAEEELYKKVGAPEFVGVADTPPRAICRAALLTVIGQ